MIDALLGFTYLALVVGLFVRTRRSGGALGWTHAIAAVFLVASAVMHFATGAGHPLAAADGALRIVTAAAGITTAFLLFGPSRANGNGNADANADANANANANADAHANAHADAHPHPHPHAPLTKGEQIIASAGAPSAEATFLGLVSHELRTPLTAMQLLLDRLADPAGEALPARHRKIVERLTGTSTRLTDLVDSILYYARLKNGKLVTSVEPFDLGTVVTEAADELRPQAERKALELDASDSSDHVAIESDPKLVRLVVINLISNAVKFTDRGRVAVSALTRGDLRIVRVEDTGRGIAKGEQELIFEPFHAVEPTRQKHAPGFGLGLSLAKQIVDNLGGEITVRSEVGRGSTFELTLPAAAHATAPATLSRRSA